MEQDSLWEEYNEVPIAEVAPDLDVPGMEDAYSYRIPDFLGSTLQPGQCVQINFAGRDATGYVLSRKMLPAAHPLCTRLKPLIAIVEEAPVLSAEQLQMIRILQQTTLCSLVSAVRCVAPAASHARVSVRVCLANPELKGSDLAGSLHQAHIVEVLRAEGGEADLEELRSAAALPSFRTAYNALLRRGLIAETRSLQHDGARAQMVRAVRTGSAVGSLAPGSRISPQQQRALQALQTWEAVQSGPMPVSILQQRADVSAAVVRALVRKGALDECKIRVRRTPLLAEKSTAPPPLTEEQKAALKQICQALEEGAAQTMLLHGVTASGKTEVYLHAIEQTLLQKRGAIVLLPEIALTAQVADAFVARFGDQVALMHSRLSEGERFDEWQRLQTGEARIVVGARSALFAPVENVGLIILDEEHETSYKQDKTPRYSARDTARERARLTGAVLLLGSATPSLESYASTLIPHPEGIAPQTAQRIEMLHRVSRRPLPDVCLVDMREEFKQRRALFSQRLTEAIAYRLQRGEQTILFLNRRGYASFVLCRDCGHTPHCPACDVSLTYHLHSRALRCHHCDHFEPAPTLCPKCGGSRVRAFGIGTEKVEEEIAMLYPEARVVRMDRDTTAHKDAHLSMVRTFRSRKADILIGTQMVAKGLDFPGVTLVGVVSADTTLNMPDFRASERTFQLLTQVAGRAGRGELAGEVIVQTFTPEHYAVQAALRHDYHTFFARELEFRRELRYPPFSRFANLIFNDAEEAAARRRAERFAGVLQPLLPPGVDVIGPSPAPLARLKNQFRFHLALRAPHAVDLPSLLHAALGTLPAAERAAVIIDIDPVVMM